MFTGIALALGAVIVFAFGAWFGVHERSAIATVELRERDGTLALLRAQVFETKAHTDEWRRQAATAGDIAKRSTDAYAKLVDVMSKPPRVIDKSAVAVDPPTVGAADKKKADERKRREEMEMLPTGVKDRRRPPVPRFNARDTDEDDEDDGN